jgi:hypothetical protein
MNNLILNSDRNIIGKMALLRRQFRFIAILTVAILTFSPVNAMQMTELMGKVVESFATKITAESSQSATPAQIDTAVEEYDKLSERLFSGLTRHLEKPVVDLFLKRVSEMDKVSRLAFATTVNDLNGAILASLQENGPDAVTLRRVEAISRILTSIREEMPSDSEISAYLTQRPFENAVAFPDAADLATASMDKAIGDVQLSMDSCDSNGASLTLRFPAITSTAINQDGLEFQNITMKGCGLTSTVGYPSLPALRLFLALPSGGKPKLTLGNIKNRTITSILPYPVQPPLLDIKGYTAPFTMDDSAYASSKSYPDRQVVTTRSGKVRDMNILMVEIYPAIFRASSRNLQVMDEISLKIDFGISAAETSTKNVGDADSPTAVSGNFNGLYKGMFLNGMTPSTPGSRGAGILNDHVYRETPENGAEYLIIAADELADAVAPLAEWKKMRGLFPKIVKVSEIPGDTSDPENIRRFVLDCYSTFNPRPSYLLLVGDIETVPTFHRVIPTYGTVFGGPVGSDHYYSMIDGKDLFSDLFVGRLSGKNPEEISIQVNKIINYEKNPNMEDTSWFRRVISAGFKQEGRIFHETAMFVKSYMEQNGFQVRKAFSWEGDSTSAIIDAFNEGVNIVSYRGHGQPEGWDVPEFKIPALNSLNNTDKLPVMFGTTCLAGNFDRTDIDCFGEAIMKLPGGGTVGFLGASKPSYSFYNDEFLKGMYWALYQDGMNSIGEVMAQGQTYMVKKYGIEKKTEDMFEFYSILTDPSLAIWSDVPSRAKVVCKPLIDESVKRFMIEVTLEDGSAVNEAKVTLIKNDDNYYRSRYTNAKGRCAFIDPEIMKTSGDVTISITGRNIIPQTIIIPVKR